MAVTLLPPFFPADTSFLSNAGKPRPPHFKAISAVCTRGCATALPTLEAQGLALTLHHQLRRAVVVLWPSQNPSSVSTWANTGLVAT